MDPRQFLQTVVLPNVAELETEFGSAQRAFNAVASVDAMAAQLYAWCKIHAPAEVAQFHDDTVYREQLADRNSEFRLLRDVAKAQKHVELTRGTPLVVSSKQIDVRSLGFGQMRFDEGRFGGPPQVVVQTNDNDLRVVETIIANALAFLTDEMIRVGVP